MEIIIVITVLLFALLYFIISIQKNKFSSCASCDKDCKTCPIGSSESALNKHLKTRKLAKEH